MLALVMRNRTFIITHADGFRAVIEGPKGGGRSYRLTVPRVGPGDHVRVLYRGTITRIDGGPEPSIAIGHPDIKLMPPEPDGDTIGIEMPSLQKGENVRLHYNGKIYQLLVRGDTKIAFVVPYEAEIDRPGREEVKKARNGANGRQPIQRG